LHQRHFQAGEPGQTEALSTFVDDTDHIDLRPLPTGSCTTVYSPERAGNEQRLSAWLYK
jgi:hypothetical protein